MKKLFLTTLTLACYFNAYSQENGVSESEKEKLKQEIKQEIKQELLNENEKESLGSKIKEFTQQKIKFSGRSTIRVYEQDFNQRRLNSQNETYTQHDRYWSRYNFYLNMDAKLSKDFAFHARVRSGNSQYSYINFGGNSEERLKVMLDQASLDFEKGNYSAKLGRQSAIWKSQDGIQFDVPTHDGISAKANFKLSENTSLETHGAFFAEMYRNNTGIKDQGRIYGGEARINTKTKFIDYHARTGLIFANSLPNRYANLSGDEVDNRAFHDGDLAKDYSIWTNGIEVVLKTQKNITFAVDIYKNLKNYKTNPESHLIKSHVKYDVTPDFRDQTFGMISTLKLGGLSKPKDWFLSGSYLHLEKYAAMDYFAQYDFARWASSNIKGYEFKAGYRLTNFLSTQAIFFITEDLKAYNANNFKHTDKGNRFRLDLIVNF